MHVQYPAYKHSLTQNFGSGKAFLIGLSIVLFVGVTCTGCRQESLDEEELKIPAKLSHSYKEEQLEINSDEVKQASKSYTDDEIHPPVHEPPEEHLVKLYNLVKEKKAGQAEAALLAEIKKNPGESRAYAYLGKVYRELDEFPKAIKAFDKAIKLAPHDAFPYCLRAEANYARERYNLAISDCNKTLEHNQNYLNALAIRGESYLQTGQYEKAIEDLKLYAARTNNNAMVYVDLGDAHLELGQLDQSIQAYNKALELNKENGLVLARRSRAFALKGDEKAAQADRSNAEALGYKFISGKNDLKSP